METRLMTANANETPCPRCHGEGVIRAFAHVENGLCFKCRGRGTLRPKSAKAPQPRPPKARLSQDARMLLREIVQETQWGAELAPLKAVWIRDIPHLTSTRLVKVQRAATGPSLLQLLPAGVKSHQRAVEAGLIEEASK